MVYGLWLSSAGLQVNEYRQATLANNLANAETAGFKRHLAVISARQVASRSTGGLGDGNRLLDDLSGGSLVRPTHTDFSDGPLRASRNPLDLAVPGRGFLVVRDGEEVLFTKDGRLTLDSQGRLVTAAGGRPVLDADERPIVTVPGAAAPVRVGSDGTVRQGGAVLGRLAVVAFEDPQALVKRGAGLFAAAGQEPVPQEGGVVSGAVEASNVSPVTSLASLIEVSRAYQMNATLLSLQDQTLGRAVNDIAKVA